MEIGVIARDFGLPEIEFFSKDSRMTFIMDYIHEFLRTKIKIIYDMEDNILYYTKIALINLIDMKTINSFSNLEAYIGYVTFDVALNVEFPFPNDIVFQSVKVEF
jgi:hypothetical protein